MKGRERTVGREGKASWGWGRAAASALLPGAGQVAGRRWGDGLLFFLVAAWVHLTLAGLGARGSAPVSWAWTVGALRALAGGGTAALTTPTMVVFTALALAVHLWSARDALSPHDEPS